MNDESKRKYYIFKKLFFCLRREEISLYYSIVKFLCDEKKTFCLDRFLVCNQIIDRTGTPQASQIRLRAGGGVWRYFFLLKIMEYVCWWLLQSSNPLFPWPGDGAHIDHDGRCSWCVYHRGKLLLQSLQPGLICHKQKCYIYLSSCPPLS